MKASGDFKKLEKFLKIDPVNKTRLSMHLGYATTMTIDHWVKNKKLPNLKRNKILSFIERNMT